MQYLGPAALYLHNAGIHGALAVFLRAQDRPARRSQPPGLIATACRGRGEDLGMP